MTKHETPRFDVLTEDLKKIKNDVRELKKGTKIVSAKAKSVEELAYLGSPELKTLETPRHERFEPLKRDAMAIDIAGSLQILAMGLGVIAEYAIPSAYSVKSAHTRIEAIEKSIDKIAKETNVDISKIKADLSNVKQVIDSENVNIVADYIKDFNKKVAEYKKKMTENDLAE